MIKLVTPSRRALLRHCQAWARGDMPLNDSAGRAAEEGKRAHLVVDRHAKRVQGLEPRVAKRLRAGVEEACAWIDSLGERLVGTEIAYRLDLDTGAAERTDVVDRQYPDDGGVHGTADVVYRNEAGEIVVRDWKSGRPSPATRDQLEVLALMIGARSAEVGYLEDYRIEPVSIRALPAILAELRADVARVRDAWAEPSAACDAMYCPARKTCEAYAIDRMGAA